MYNLQENIVRKGKTGITEHVLYTGMGFHTGITTVSRFTKYTDIPLYRFVGTHKGRAQIFTKQ